MLTTTLLLSALALPQQQGTHPAAVRALPHLGVTIRDERSLDPTTGAWLRRTVAADGRAVDGDALRRAEIAARDVANGKLHPTLVGKLAEGGTHEVAFWLVRPNGMPDLRAVIDAARAEGLPPEDARRRALATARTFVLPGNETFAAAARAAGGEVTLVDEITPVVFVRLLPEPARALALRAEVDLAYWSSPRWEEEGTAPGLVGPPPPNHWASRTARTDVVHRRGITGAGVKVMVNDTAPVATVNPNLPPVISGSTGTASAHATAVAGIIASRHATETGAAPGLVQLYSHGGNGDTGAPIAWAWGMGQGISFGNCSWWNLQKGRIQFLDRYFDYIIRNFAVMMFKSSGNQGTGDGLVTTPGNGYNMTASGNSDDRNNHDWNDDAMNSSSSWVNPLEGHDKPEVTACGTTITTTTTSSPWIGAQGSGTSYATPVTCGTAALLAETVPALQAQPELVRALIMAGAFHNIEGAARLSDRDGVGHINAAASQSATARGQFHSANLTAASFSGGVYDVPVSLVGNDETRICGVWFSTADSSYATDVLQMDLDLTVLWGTTVIASSASAVNPFEIVQFVPPFTGTYTLRFTRQRFDGTSEPFAVAWVSRRNAATNEVLITGNPVPGGTVNFEFVDTYHPGATYIAALSPVGPPATLPVGPLKVVEFGHDVLVSISMSLPGFSGVLPANGRGAASLPIPNQPGLTGLQLHVAMVTLDFSLPELAEETSPISSFTIQ